jgi:hypothetical protein
MVGMKKNKNWITSISTSCFWISASAISNILGEVELIQVWWCPILWLPIGILCGVEYGCEYNSGTMLLNWMDGWICQLYGPNWCPNSMPFNIF